MEVKIAVLLIILQLLKPGLTTTSIEPCPPDSVLIENICKCNPEYCQKPSCGTVLSIIANGTDVPGNCCTKYSCKPCDNNTLSSDCTCPPDAVLNSNNQCKCVDAEKEIINGTCTCNAALCSLPEICDAKSVLVSRQTNGCCKKTTCIPCPPDSFVEYRGSTKFEEMCVCYKCTPKKCGVNEKPRIIKAGTNLPNNCCDIYECESITTNKTCVYNNTVYYSGSRWTTHDNKNCICNNNGISECTHLLLQKSKNCLKEGKLYVHNKSWMEDSCTNCTCDNGESKCISHLCDFKETPVKKHKCPEMLNCNKTCPFGYKVKRKCFICKCNNNPYLKLNRTSTTTMSPTTITNTIFSSNNNPDPTVVKSNSQGHTHTIIIVAASLFALLLGTILIMYHCKHKEKKQKYETVSNNNINNFSVHKPTEKYTSLKCKD